MGCLLAPSLKDFSSVNGVNPEANMIEFVNQALHELGTVAISAIAAATALGAAGAMLREIALGLRAKRRARYFMQAAMREATFRDLVKQAYQPSLESHMAEVDVLRRSVEAHLKALSETDRRLVGQGLHQRSRAGAERYLKELVSAPDLREVA